MTAKEKAIKILDPENPWRALKLFGGFVNDVDLVIARGIACEALRAQQAPAKLDRSRWEGCSECSKPWCITCVRYDSRSTGTPCTTSCIGYSKHEPVRFCKNCGRPLIEDAWAELERRINGGKADNAQ